MGIDALLDWVGLTGFRHLLSIIYTHGLSARSILIG